MILLYKGEKLMKIRTDFVTNSSSSSFTIRKKDLTAHQIKAIQHHDILGEKMGLEYFEDKWRIGEENGFITGITPMNNFDMEEFLGIIGVDPRLITWGMYELEFPESEVQIDTVDWKAILDEIE